MKRQMDHFMADNQRAPAEQIENWRTAFLEAIDRVSSAFGDHAFHRWVPEKHTWRKQVLASLFDAQMNSPTGVGVSEILTDSSDPERRYLPGHPDADSEGYVAFPKINPAEDMVDLMGSARTYELTGFAPIPGVTKLK